MATLFRIIFISACLLIPNILIAHKVTLEDKSVEEIVKKRMALMQKIKSTSSQISKLLQTNDYEALFKLNSTLQHTASDFKEHFPEGTQYKTASDEIWNDRKTFNEFNDKFISDIEMISLSIELEDNEMLNDAFKAMAANCGSCHKKFRN
jgi:Cytochrome c556